MKKSVLLFLSLFLFGFISFSQKNKEIKLRQNVEKFELKSKSNNGFIFQATLSQLNLTSVNTKKGQFFELNSKNLIRSYQKGNPELPVYSRLIEVPQDAKVKISIVSYDEEIINLTNQGITEKITPAQPSLRKDLDPKDVPFYYNEKIYKTDKFFSLGKTAIYEDAGQMRDAHIGRIEIRPIQYNPVKNQLKVLNNLVVKVDFEGAAWAKTNQLKQKYSSAFAALPSSSFIYKLDNNKELIQDAPITYVIVADRSFETALQPFVQWKTLKGFKVVEAYTDDSNIGNTVTSIKAYLQDLYENPPAGQNPPSFVLVVGDIDIIPATQHSEVSDSPYSDLDLVEYTGDYLPEVNYGRWSADNADQVSDIVYKTVRYEKLEMDPAYLSNTFLVAGDDEGYEDTYGGGAMWYGNEYYFNAEHNIDNHLWLQSTIESWGGNTDGNSLAHDSIIYMINQGVALANYTAHCSSDGWYKPSFTQNDLNNYITNTDKYGLWIGNCCQSNMFNVNEAFSELAIRKPNAGVIGYIGGSQYTYWDGDYYWGVGVASIVANPSYDSSTEGCYDGLFHDKANEVNDLSTWFTSNYQFNKAGLLAVQASSATNKAYYWCIYQLAGDPSIISFVGTPQPMTVTPSPAALMIGMTSLNVISAPYSYVALSQNGTLIAAAVSDASGNASLSFASDALSIGDADLVVTAQNRVPYIGTITVSPANEPYIILNSYTTSASPDYGQSITLNVTLENVAASGSGYDALNTNAVLSLTDPYITIIDGTEDYGTITAGTTKNIDNAFSVTIADNVPDQYTFSFDLTITGQDGSSTNYTWPATLDMTANAPVLSIGSLIVNDASGNGNGILDPGETADIVIETSNIGNAQISNTIGTISYTGTDLVINSATTSPFNISVNETKLFAFNVTANETSPVETPISIEYSVSGGGSLQYSENKDFNLILGYIPEYCESRATSQNDSRINEVILGNDINNNTTADGCSTYSDFTNMIADVVQGETDSLFLTIGTCSGDYNKAAKVFIDWNGDGDFEDSNEEVFVSNYSSSDFKDTILINIPNNTTTGKTRMRIVCQETTSPSSISACGTYDWGETEDYTLNIALPVTQGGFLDTQYDQICLGNSTGNITLSNNSGTVTDWEKRTESGTWTSIGYTGVTYSETPTNSGIWYYRCVVDGGASYSDSVSITVNDPSSGGYVSGGSTICKGSKTDLLTLTGQTGSVSNWEKQLNGESWEYLLNFSDNYSEIPSSDGTWSYRAVIKNGACSAAYSSSTDVIVNPIAVSGTVTAAKSDICTDTQTTLKVNGYIGSIQWQKSIDQINWTDISNATSDTYTSEILTADNFYRVVTGLGQCPDSISNSKKITIFNYPSANFTYTSENQKITFTNTSENASTYLWDFGNGSYSSEINPVYIYDASGTYTINLTASNGICDDNEYNENLIITYVNISKIKSYFAIIPNPNNGLFTIKTEGLSTENSTVEIYSVSGKLIYQKNMNSNAFDIDLGNQAKGIYFIKINSGNRVFNSKLIIK